MPHDFIVAIPARHDATRLPGKPLRLLGGEPLVLHVARRALAAGAREAWVATDDARVAAALEGSGVRVAMTAATHASGTDRLAECARIAGWDDDAIVVNLQGDEPFAPAAGIRAVAETLATSGAQMATLAAPVEDAGTLFDPNAVKLVRDADGFALYFSRAPIPWHRDTFPNVGAATAANAPVGAAPAAMPLPDTGFLRHIGIYAYRVSFLRRYSALSPTAAERFEALEQLRALGHGHRIAVAFWEQPMEAGVDTAEDLERVRRRLAG